MFSIAADPKTNPQVVDLCFREKKYASQKKVTGCNVNMFLSVRKYKDSLYYREYQNDHHFYEQSGT